MTDQIARGSFVLWPTARLETALRAAVIPILQRWCLRALSGAVSRPTLSSDNCFYTMQDSSRRYETV